ncbi:hypothetical protein MNBD_GAMMA06-1591 [hydrothermal vent metagenome]|uniref:DUF302 domain-containing protein n=1 Tax=hydrothermal vent metagenome TaxID=652676 RepID=A0A3B0W3M3_9ZZZZ
MKYKLITVITILLFTTVTQPIASESAGIVKIKSAHSVTTTIDKLETVLTKKGMTIFKRINHTAGAKKVNLQLRPTELLIFGNPKVGTPLMLCSQTAALDLPQKALAYKDKNGQVWLAYNDPGYMAKRHNIEGCEKAIQKVTNALAKFSKIATQ